MNGLKYASRVYQETWWVAAFSISVSADMIGASLWRHGSRKTEIYTFPLVHVGMHASYSDCPYSSHNIELWRKSSRRLWRAKRSVFICFIVAETIFLAYSTFKNYLHTDRVEEAKITWIWYDLRRKQRLLKETGKKKKKRGSIILQQEELNGTSLLLLAFFLLLCYSSKLVMSLLLCWK